jgi:protocatechuate 3,4-dioxygenase beta subunit
MAARRGRSLTGDDGKYYIADLDPGTYDFMVERERATLQGTCDAARRERHVQHQLLSHEAYMAETSFLER